MADSVIGIYIPEDEEKGRPEYIRRGASQSGWIYKNPEAFYSDPFAVCYIPELSDCTYTGMDFLKMSLVQPEIAEEMFLSVDWQHPETWLDEQFRQGELDVCEKCGKIYQSYDEAECPFCKNKEVFNIKDSGRNFLEEVMIDRIDQILRKDRKDIDDFYEEQEKILNTLEAETRAKLEEFACNILLMHAQELQAVYKEAFFDGLRLGHKVF